MRRTSRSTVVFRVVGTVEMVGMMFLPICAGRVGPASRSGQRLGFVVRVCHGGQKEVGYGYMESDERDESEC